MVWNSGWGMRTFEKSAINGMVAVATGQDRHPQEAGGKVGGREVEFFKVDDESEPSKGVENANKLVQRDKVDVLVGTVHSGVQMGIHKVARETGVLNIIPNVGPTLSTVFPVSVALLDAPWQALAVLLLYIGVQNLESYLITPSVMHHQVKLLPGLTLIAQFVFTVLFGPLGLLLALPLAVSLQVVVREVLIHDVLDPWRQQRLAG